MRKNRTPGSVRGASGNWRPYRDDAHSGGSKNVVPIKSPEDRGLVPVAPGHSVSIQTDGTSIILPRKLDLALAADRSVLKESLAGSPELWGLAETSLDAYLSFFPDIHWRLIINGGQIVVPGTGTHANTYPLPLLLQVTKELQALSHCPGFPSLLEGFRNPPQVPSALFEIQAAAWCRSRELTLGLEFSPTVVRVNHVKHPDFRWRTELGDLFCECKQANEFEAKYAAAYHRLFAALESAHGTKAWDSKLRLDVWIRLAGSRLDELLRDLLSTAWSRQQPGRVPWNHDHRLAAIFRPAAEMPPRVSDTLFGFRQHVSDVEHQVSPRHVAFSLALDISRKRMAIASHLLKEARLQLPPDRPSAVFLSLGGLEAAAVKVKELIVQPSYRSTPFVLVVAREGQARVLSRDGQAFNQCLGEPRRKGSGLRIWRCIRAPVRRGVAWCLGRV